VVAITSEDCFQDVPNKDKDTIKVPTFSKLASATTASAFKQVETAAKSPTLETLGILPVPPFLIPCLASNSHSSFEELGHACVDYLKDSELTCKDGLAISENSHCHALVQFMWWAAKRIPETEDYRIAVTLLADPRPSVVKWRGSAISGALTTEAAQPRTGQTDPGAFSDALIGTLGSLKKTMDAIVLKEPASANDTGKHFARLPDHLKTLLYRLSPRTWRARADREGQQRKAVHEAAHSGQRNLAPKDRAPPELRAQRHGAACIGPGPTDRPTHVGGRPGCARES
jgi:hypothetical protein